MICGLIFEVRNYRRWDFFPNYNNNNIVQSRDERIFSGYPLSIKFNMMGSRNVQFQTVGLALDAQF